MGQLHAAVYVAPSIPWSKPDGSEGGPWSPIACTLIYGEKDAMLVDTPISVKQTNDLADWITKTLGPSRQLTTLYITHGHGDHWFGIPTLFARFGTLNIFTTPGTYNHMKEDGVGPGWTRWATLFPNNQITPPDYLDKSVYTLSHTGEFHLEGHVLKAVDVGHSDTHDSTVLWVPTLKLAVCGDVVYGEVHQMLARANTAELRQAWIAAIEKVEALNPELVVPGHQKPGELQGVWHLRNSKEYIYSFAGFVESGTAKDARELGRLMLQKYPERFNTGALFMGTGAAFASQKKKEANI
jgi:glyoxylase-like metal-dependent hydrolase (beta-lactamase superfamily II)